MQYLKEQHNAYTLQTLSALNLNLKVISLFFWKIFLGLLGQRICAQFPYFSGLFIRWICMKIGSLFFKSSSVPTVHSSFRVIVQEQTQNSRRAALKWQTSCSHANDSGNVFEVKCKIGAMQMTLSRIHFSL